MKKKCPLRKQILLVKLKLAEGENEEVTFFPTQLKESFLECYGESCAMWDKRRQVCGFKEKGRSLQ